LANRNFTNKQLFTFEVMPVLLSCNFIVDPANGNGLGLRSLKGEGIAAVYMHTSATPAALNPNPEAGIIMVQLSDCYNRYLSGFSGQVSPLGSSVTSTTAHDPAVITSLGTATLAQWQAVGLPKGVVPALGASFIPTSSATIGGGATVAPPTASLVDNIEIVGDPNQTLISQVALPPSQVQPIGQSVGGYLILQCLQDGALQTPATGSVIGLNFLLSNSSVQVLGQ
jgi:hypothetical protein